MISCCFYVFSNNFLHMYGWTLNKVGVKFLSSNQHTKHAWHNISLDGSLIKAKAVYEQSSKVLFKQKWGIPKVSSFSPFLAGPNSPLESTQNCQKLKLFKKLHPQQEYQLTQLIPGPRIFCQLYATALYHSNRGS